MKSVFIICRALNYRQINMRHLQNERRCIVNHVFRPQINYDESFPVILKIERPNPGEMQVHAANSYITLNDWSLIDLLSFAQFI